MSQTLRVSVYPSIRVRVLRRSLVVVALVLLLTLSLLVLQLVTGDFPLTVSRVLATMTGTGDAGEEFIVYTLRLPRALTAVLAGAAFGASGAVYQSVTRNPLGSPDIIGFTFGAAFGAVFAIVVLELSGIGVTIAALTAGLGVAVLVYLLAFRSGGVQGYRLILVGIGLSSVLASLVSYLLLKAQIVDSQQAYIWLTGSLNGRSWTDVQIGLVGLAVLGPVLVALGPGLRMAEKGARESGTPFISFFTPPELVGMARDAGFKDARHVSAAALAQRYFAGRTDGLRPPNNAEELLVATT